MFYQIKIIVRNLRRGGIYSAINIGGLAIGMAAAILILAWIYHEWSYDRFHAKEKQLYVAYTRTAVDGDVVCSDWTPTPLGPALKTDYPEITATARMRNFLSFLFTRGDAKAKIQTNFTDPDFLTMFDFPLLHGSRETALNDPYSVILTEQAAIRLFGEQNPLGETLLLDGQYAVKVTGVMKDLPANTHFQFEALAPVALFKAMGGFSDHWGETHWQTYVEMSPNARLDLFNESISGIVSAHTGKESEAEIFLYPLGSRHLYSVFENGKPVGGMINTLRIFGLIASLILLIACINFMNLSTARSRKRAKEVGVRKVMGGSRLSLINLFLGESMVIASIAGAIALILALAILPLFSTLMGKQMSLNLADIRFWLAGIGFVVFTGLLAGSYPAFYLSAFLPVKVLKGIFGKKQGLISSRKVLVVIQFTVACVLILSTLVVHRQIRYAQDRESGYDRDQLGYVLLEGETGKNYELIKHDLISSGTAISISKTSAPVTVLWGNTWWGVNWRGKDPNARILFDMYFADADWTKTAGIRLVNGRDIDIYTYPTDSTALLLNESAVKVMNFDDPVGETVNLLGKDWHVVGVVKDFIIQSPYATVNPMVIGGPAGGTYVMHIKLNGANRMADNLAKAEQIFRQYNPTYPFEYHFTDEQYARKFMEEQKLGSLATWFAALTIFISCMGLFALVAYMAETRRKEIGIRKVLGASVGNVILLLSKEFLMLTLIAVAIASPIAWWAMNQWLAGFAYRTGIPWWLFVTVGCMSVGIALLTVGFQAVKAAMANPARAIGE
ncbi:MAG: ABC transporter permease [Tannerella sp.]|jgi:ABC-type antimicrobial peptide transport system permease subunit|nr:ABC transporter permease [Tannerella sp.]